MVFLWLSRIISALVKVRLGKYLQLTLVLDIIKCSKKIKFTASLHMRVHGIQITHMHKKITIIRSNTGYLDWPDIRSVTIRIHALFMQGLVMLINKSVMIYSVE